MKTVIEINGFTYEVHAIITYSYVSEEIFRCTSTDPTSIKQNAFYKDKLL